MSRDPQSKLRFLVLFITEAQMLLVFLHTCAQAECTRLWRSSTCTIHPGAGEKKKTKPAISGLSCFAGLMADLHLEMLKFGREKTKQKYYVRENFTGHCG